MQRLTLTPLCANKMQNTLAHQQPWAIPKSQMTENHQSAGQKGKIRDDAFTEEPKDQIEHLVCLACAKTDITCHAKELYFSSVDQMLAVLCYYFIFCICMLCSSVRRRCVDVGCAKSPQRFCGRRCRPLNIRKGELVM